MPLFGTSVLRVEDDHLLRGHGRYVANLPLPGAAHVTYVTSPLAHGRIVRIDTSAAEALPGILGVFSTTDVDLGPLPPPFLAEADPELGRSLLASGVVRFVGEPIVAIVSETRESGADAADLVEVDLEALGAVSDPLTALSTTDLLYPGIETNLVSHDEGGSSDVDLDRCEVVVRHTFLSRRVAPCPLETRAGASSWDAAGRLHHWSACQNAHSVWALLCSVYGLEPTQVQVVAPDVGGSFGAKARPYPEELLLPWLAARLGRPVRWVPPRSKDMVGLGHSRPQVQHVSLGGRRDGTIEAIELRIVADAGAYVLSGPLLGRSTGVLGSGAYRIDRVRWEVDAVVTNTTPVVAYRGAGRPESAAAVERAVDLFASEIGLSPVEVRRRNFLEAFPYTSPTGVVHDSGAYARRLDLALEIAGHDELRAEQEARRAAGDPIQLGVGIATFVDRTAGYPGTEFGGLELRADGSLCLRTGSSPHGQGHHTGFAMLVSERTGVPVERIEVIHGDTDVVPRGMGTGGSRTLQRGGVAAALAADELVLIARRAAADLLEAAFEDVVLDVTDGGRFHVVGTASRSVSWAGVAEAAVEPLSCETDFEGPMSISFGAYLAVVEVDMETGKVTLRRLVTVDDAGRILNPLLASGQVHGGAAQGVAQALLEGFTYDREGNPLTATFADYAVISAAELPFFEGAFVESPSPSNPLGVKGIGESGSVGAPPAVQNAVLDALAPLGVRHIDMPCTPEAVWQALRAARAG